MSPTADTPVAGGSPTEPPDPGWAPPGCHRTEKAEALSDSIVQRYGDRIDAASCLRGGFFVIEPHRRRDNTSPVQVSPL